RPPPYPSPSLRRLSPLPTRRSSDLLSCSNPSVSILYHNLCQLPLLPRVYLFYQYVQNIHSGMLSPGKISHCLLSLFCHAVAFTTDRKSTRLNSSHRTISYAVFCLKK